MRADSLVLGVAGVFFGLILGWVIGSQQVAGSRPPAAAAPQAQATPPPQGGSQPAVLDQGRVQALRAVAEQNPRDAEPRVALGNLYFDAEQFQDAITWYEAALAINPNDPNVSTDLGVAYYYTNQPARGVKQFEHSLSVDPKHTKTLLNMGIVKAFGLQDLEGASAAWKQVVALAPSSPEGQQAQKLLDGLAKAHPGGGGASGGP
ncbi:MAG: tetratricopeptide repeat protein [Acidobacteriota bacterium]